MADLTTLARAVTALPGFEWREGMIDDDGVVVLDVHDDSTITTSELVNAGTGFTNWQEHRHGRPPEVMAYCVPDLEHPANGGILLAMLGQCQVVYDGLYWAVKPYRGKMAYELGATLAEAAARALVALGKAPGTRGVLDG